MAEVLDDTAIATGLARVSWDRQGDELVKVHKEAGFAGALQYVNRVGELAEAANHHPDIDIRWNTVTLRLSTHSAGGITQADLDMAARIDGLG
ncbi:MAG TPA: 4a-hydroxytetrahydrobiopterin dehydratase [Acidimicrobiales bacterium]|jgi:4a-hydroxytetrahydrobiopterin dehydratase|nr:4a-hydroxytetrahydrobiopterin dehydratase [Acidimicrobiales bacterium]